MTIDLPEDRKPASAAASNPGRISLFLQPPGLRFHLAMAFAAVLLLWSVSVPGIVLFAFLGVAGMVLVGSAVWLVRLIGRIVVGRRTPARAETGARQRSRIRRPYGASRQHCRHGTVRNARGGL